MKKQLIPVLLLSMCLFAAASDASAQQKRSPGFNHLALYVTDLQKSTWFYSQVLDLDTMPEPFHDGRHTWLKLGPHGQLHLISGATVKREHDKNTHLCLSVADVNEVMNRLDKNRITYANWPGTSKSPTIRVDGVKQIYLQDPDGYWIEINDDKY